MASELHVDAIKHSGGTSALTIDSSGNLTTSANLNASTGLTVPSGQIIQVQKSSIRTSASTFSSSTLAEVSSNYRVSITPKLASSSYILCNFSYHAIVDGNTHMGVAIYVSTDGGSNFVSAMDGGGQNPSVAESHRNENSDRDSCRSHTATFYDIYSTTDTLIFTVFANRASGSGNARINDNGGGSFLTCMEVV